MGMIDIGGPFCKVTFSKVNLNSVQQVNEFLLTQGWIPTEQTPTGKPKLTEDSYGSIKGELGKLIAKRAVLKHRGGLIFNITKQGELKGYLNIIRNDNRIEASAISNATNTGRMAHRNLVNCPKPKDKDLWPSNTQLRELLIVPDDKLMMGVDADGLEARMEAHSCKPYPGGEEYAFELIDGDIHEKNRILFDTTRDGAKPIKYGLTYGAQPFKVNIILGVKPPANCKKLKNKKFQCEACSIVVRGECKGANAFDNFWEGNTALAGFRDRITQFWKTKGQKKFIIGIDGRKIWVRNEHSIVNAYFQSTGSITVKVAALFLDKWCRQAKMEAQQIIIYHDELQYEVPPEESDEVAELMTKAFVKAGKYLKIRVPVTGTPKVGRNWRETH